VYRDTHQNKSTLLIDLDQTAFDLYEHFGLENI